MRIKGVKTLYFSGAGRFPQFYEAKYNLGKVKTKPMQRCCLGYLGGSRVSERGNSCLNRIM